MIIWINKRLALALHSRQLAEHGGSDGVRDEGLLDAVLAEPQRLHATTPPPDLAVLAASLAYGLAHRRPFVDGNKRAAAVACETFIRLNSGELEANDVELYPMYIGLAEGHISQAEFAAWLHERIVLVTGNRVHERRAAYGR